MTMNEKIKKSNIVIIVIAFLTVLAIVSVMFCVNLSKNKTLEVEATVKLIGDNYIIVENDNGEKYSLKTDKEYNIGDRIDFVIKNIKTNSNPKEGTVVKIDVISEEIKFYITDNTNDTNDTNNQENTKPAINFDSNQINKESGTETDVIAYFNNLNDQLTNYNNNKSIGDSLKSSFITIVDFLFYEGEIKGKTFNELSTKAKIKVLQIAFSIDAKIDKCFPGYKETISSTGNKVYTNIKSKATQVYLDITTEVCENNSDVCETAKQGLTDLKTSFSLTWDFIKNISGIGLTKLKAWYEVWKTA